MTEKDMLLYAYENDMINMDDIQQQIEVNERKKYLQSHDGKIWQGKDGRFRTYLKDESGDRHLICKAQKKDLEDEVIKHYKSVENEPTLRELFYLWTSRKLKYGEMQRQTFDRYERDFKRFFENTVFFDRKVRYITADELEDFIRSTIHEKKLTSKAWSNLRTLLNGMFHYAKRNGYSKILIREFLDELDLSQRIFTKREQKSEFEEVFTEEELSKLISYLKSKPNLNNLGILLAAYTGMRVGEIVGLKYEDIYDEYVYVHRTQINYKDSEGKTVYTVRNSPKSFAGVRKVVISEAVKPILEQIKAFSGESEFLFVENGKHKTIHALTMALYAACEKIGIPKRSMHKLRKTNATHLFNAGVPESLITDQIGHSDIATTKRHYYYNDKKLLRIKDEIDRALDFDYTCNQCNQNQEAESR